METKADGGFALRYGLKSRAADVQAPWAALLVLLLQYSSAWGKAGSEELHHGYGISFLVQSKRLYFFSASSTAASFSWAPCNSLRSCCLLQSPAAFPRLPSPSALTNELTGREGRGWEMNFTNVFATTSWRAPAHGGHVVWHVFNQSNQRGPHLEYYLQGTDSLWRNYAAIFNGGNDSASNKKKYCSNHHQLLMDNSQMGLRAKALSLKSYSDMVKLPYVSHWDRRILIVKSEFSLKAAGKSQSYFAFQQEFWNLSLGTWEHS